MDFFKTITSPFLKKGEKKNDLSQDKKFKLQPPETKEPLVPFQQKEKDTLLNQTPISTQIVKGVKAIPSTISSGISKARAAISDLPKILYGSPEEAREMGVMAVPEKPISQMTEEEIQKVARGEEIDSDYIYVDLFGMGGGLRNVAKEGLDQIGKAFLRNIKATKGKSWLRKGVERGLEKIGLKQKNTPMRSTVWQLMRERYGKIKSALFDSAAFRAGIKRELTKTEREAIPFIREGTSVPKKFNRPDIEAIVKKPSQKVKQIAKAVGDYYDEGFDFLSKNWDELGFVDDYVNRIWDVPKNKIKGVTSYFTTRNPFLKKRTIPTLSGGIKQGLKPKTTDIIELLEVYDSYKINTVANKKFVQGLKNLINPETGQKVIQRIDKAPTDFISISHKALSKGLGIPTKKEGVVAITKLPVGVDPQIAREIKTIFGNRFSSKGIKALDTVNAFAKKTALSLSFFHHWALSESAISAGVKKKMLKLWNPRNIYRALKKGEYTVLKELPLAKDSVKHGLQLGAITDVQAHRVHKALRTLEYRTKEIPIVKGITKTIRGFNETWDKALWDYYHNGLKLYTYEKWAENSLKKSTKPTAAVKKEVAQLVNDTFGGQVWENLLVTPKARQALHWLLLSPDWTLSTIRQAGAPFAKGIRGKLGRKFWARAAFYMWGSSNIINGVMSKKHLGEWRWMWENDPKHKTYIFLGYNEDGSKKYLRFGKQYREIFEWISDPIKKFGSKLAPTTREAYKQLSGYSVTGWESEWAKESTWSAKAIGERAKSLMKMGLPYSISTVTRAKNLLGIAMPISKGLTWYEGRDLMVDAIQDKDKDQLAESWRALLENNVNARSVFDAAKREVELKKRPELKDAQDIIDKARKMEKEKGRKWLRDEIEKGNITPEMLKSIEYLLEQEVEVKKQKEKAGI